MNMQSSKSIWVGVAMVLAGGVEIVATALGSPIGISADPATMIATGLGIVTLRLGIAKNGKEV